MNDLFVQFLALGGTAALIAAIVNVSKNFGLPDGYANKVSAALSIAAFATLVYLKVFEPNVDVSYLDGQAAYLAEKILYLLGLAVQLGLPSKFHELFRNGQVPLIGFSYSLEDILDYWKAQEAE